MSETTTTKGAGYIEAPRLATQADIARLEAKIDRLLAVLENLDRYPLVPSYPVPCYPWPPNMPPVLTWTRTTGTTGRIKP